MKEKISIVLTLYWMAVMFVVGLFVGIQSGVNEGQKDALLGKQKYEMKVLYEYQKLSKKVMRPYLSSPNDEIHVFYWADPAAAIAIMYYDSIYYDFVPVDTLIIKKKK